MQLYRYFVSQSSEFCHHNPLCCFPTNSTECKCIFRYGLIPETFGYTLVACCNKVENLSHAAHVDLPVLKETRRTVSVVRSR